MFLLMGLEGKVKQCGIAQHASCPVCQTMGSLHICNRYITPHIFFIPTVRLRAQYIATCSHCASLFAVDKAVGRVFERDPHTVIPLESLQVLQNNKHKRCGRCGTPSHPDQNFCSHCGNQL